MQTIKQAFITCFLAAGMLALITGCNDSGKSKTDTKTDTSVTTEPSKVNTGPVMDADSTYDDPDDTLKYDKANFQGPLYVLKMTKEQFQDVFNNKKINKMIKFRFEVKDGGWSMYAYPTGRNGRRTNLERIHLDIASKEYSIPFTEADTDYREVISRGQVKAYFKQPTGTDEAMDETKFDEVWLTPCRRISDNKIFFMITAPGTIAKCPKDLIDGGGDLNPSPPDNPCIALGGCDNPPAIIKTKK